jgi:hypothetical protein
MKRIDHIVKEATYRGMFYVAHYENDFPSNRIKLALILNRAR